MDRGAFSLGPNAPSTLAPSVPPPPRERGNDLSDGAPARRHHETPGIVPVSGDALPSLVCAGGGLSAGSVAEGGVDETKSTAIAATCCFCIGAAHLLRRTSLRCSSIQLVDALPVSR